MTASLREALRRTRTATAVVRRGVGASLALALLLAGPDAAAASKFEAGQVWTFLVEGKESAARIIVGKAETLVDLGPTVHIIVVGIPAKDPSTGAQRTYYIWHLPMSARALEASVASILSSVSVPPEFKKAYDEWRDRRARHNARVIDRPVSAVLKGIFPDMMPPPDESAFRPALPGPSSNGGAARGTSSQ